jgi:hypothetical protein
MKRCVTWSWRIPCDICEAAEDENQLADPALLRRGGDCSHCADRHSNMTSIARGSIRNVAQRNRTASRAAIDRTSSAVIRPSI